MVRASHMPQIRTESELTSLPKLAVHTFCDCSHSDLFTLVSDNEYR